MKAQVTPDQVSNIGNKIISLTITNGNVTYYIAKYFTMFDEFVVVTRKGLTDFIVHKPELIPFVGKKGIHFEKFKTAVQASDFINNLSI